MPGKTLKGRSRAADPAVNLMTPMQRRFVDAYLGEAMGDVTEAARVAGYKHPEHLAQRIMVGPVAAEILARTKPHMDADECLRRLAAIVRADLADVGPLIAIQVDGPRGKHKLIEELKRLQALGVSWLIKEIAPGKHGISVKLHSPTEALAMLCKYHGLLVDRIKIGPDVDVTTMTTAELIAIRDGQG